MLNGLEILNVGSGTVIGVHYEVYFWVLMSLNLILISIAKTLNQNYIGSLFSTAIINRQLLQKTQEELKLGSASSILLTVTYFTSIAALVSFVAVQEYGNTVLLLIGILLGSALFKWVLMWLLSFIIQFRGGIVEHGMNHLIYYQVAGIILTPILILTHFLPVESYQFVAWGSLIIAVLIILVREIQSIGRALKSRVSVLYILLYLCTLELMPLVLIIYAFVNNSAGLN